MASERTRHWIGGAIVAAAMAIAGGAFAQPSDADRGTARTLAEEGKKALEAKDYATAENRFSRADALVHAPTLLLGLARAQAGLGKYVAAKESYQRILREGVPAGSPSQWSRALDDAKKEVDAVAAHVAWITVRVQGPGAPEVAIDGAAVPAAALGAKRPVDPGDHVIRATADGFEPAETKVALKDAEEQEVSLPMKAAPKAATPPPSPTSAAPRAAPPSPPPPSSRKTLGVIALAGGVVGLGVGGVTGALALKKHGELTDACPEGTCTAAQHDALGSYRTMAMISTVGFVAGGVLAATGIVLVATAPSTAPQKVGVVVGPTGAAVRGRF